MQAHTPRHCHVRAEQRASGRLRATAPSAPPPAVQSLPRQTTPEWASRYTHNPALSGNWAPVAREVVLDDLRVEGRLPASIAGVWLRNGPNPLHEPIGGHHHLFDGPGMLHWLRLREDGSASYGACSPLGARLVARRD